MSDSFFLRYGAVYDDMKETTHKGTLESCLETSTSALVIKMSNLEI